MKNLLLIIGLVTILFSSCQQESQVASQNLSYEAHEFKIFRRVVFYNGITDTYILEIKAYCSVVTEEGRLAVVIKTDSGQYLKHYLGLSDNVTYFAEQLEAKYVSGEHYSVIFNPSLIVPKVDLK
jgi:hypothetical protein